MVKLNECVIFSELSLLGGSDSNIDPYKFNKGSLQSCTITTINMSLVEERQDSKEGKCASERQNTPMPRNGWHHPGKTTRPHQSKS
jgi:uncharacterized OsmC-like protein